MAPSIALEAHTLQEGSIPMATRVGRRYIVGPADRPYVEGDPAFKVHTVVDDDSTVEGCV
jgi:hypothetical protein